MGISGLEMSPAYQSIEFPLLFRKDNLACDVISSCSLGLHALVERPKLGQALFLQFGQTVIEPLGAELLADAPFVLAIRDIPVAHLVTLFLVAETLELSCLQGLALGVLLLLVQRPFERYLVGLEILGEVAEEGYLFWIPVAPAITARLVSSLLHTVFQHALNLFMLSVLRFPDVSAIASLLGGPKRTKLTLWSSSLGSSSWGLYRTPYYCPRQYFYSAMAGDEKRRAMEEPQGFFSAGLEGLTW